MSERYEGSVLEGGDELRGMIVTEPEDRIDAARKNWSEIYPEIDTSHLAIFSRMRLIVDGLSLSMSAVLSQFDMTRADFDIISQLIRNRRPMTPSELAEGSSVTGAGTTKRLNRLESRGLITRRSNPEDGRGSLVEPTPEVHEAFGPVLHAYSEMECALLEDFSEAELAALEGGLRRLVQRIERAHPGIHSTAPTAGSAHEPQRA